MSFVIVCVLVLGLVTMVIEVLCDQYGRAVVRHAINEGVRAGSRDGAGVPECQAAAARVLNGGLGGTMGQDIQIVCTINGNEVIATATGRWSGWLPVSPAWNINNTATAAKQDQ
jgi:hypothetical protein